jgi:tetratricopeptide (TPR) repeat protein
MSVERWKIELHEALRAADDPAATPVERAEMLMEIALELQQRPKSAEHLDGAVALYERALELVPGDERLLRARLSARRATALQAMPEEGTAALEEARRGYEGAIPILTEFGRPEEVAEAEINLGLVLQCLAGVGRAPMGDAVAAYQRALRTFNRVRYPVEFAILQNNLATAFLAMAAGEGAQVREALAVQAFEEGLKIVTLAAHPAEYAMLQNNLGNALQYAASGHNIENNLRALEAYDEAPKVRTRAASPLEYANTIANKANCLMNLPDDPTEPDLGNPRNLSLARAYLEEAQAIFNGHGELEKARLLAEPLAALIG